MSLPNLKFQICVQFFCQNVHIIVYYFVSASVFINFNNRAVRITLNHMVSQFVDKRNRREDC